MRFHMGVSFNWRTIKKFLIPILIGIATYFGLNFLNGESIPLGFIKTYALENYSTSFNIDYSSYDSYSEYTIDTSGTKISDFVDSLKNNTSLTRPYLIMPYYVSNSIYSLYFFVFDTSSTYVVSMYGRFGTFNSIIESDGSKWGYKIDTTGTYAPSNIYNTSQYNNFITCASGGACSDLSGFDSDYKLFTSSTSINNNSDNDLYFSNDDFYVLYYSTFPLVLSNTYESTSATYFYKSIYVDTDLIPVGTAFTTYYDYSHPVSPEPEPEPEPTPDEDTEHKALFYKIFWFDDNSTVLGVLTSIYELLLLYCVGMLLLRFITIIKNTRW